MLYRLFWSPTVCFKGFFAPFCFLPPFFILPTIFICYHLFLIVTLIFEPYLLLSHHISLSTAYFWVLLPNLLPAANFVCFTAYFLLLNAYFYVTYLSAVFYFFFLFLLFLIFFLLIQNRTGVILQNIEKFVDICRVINLHHKWDLSLRKLNIICRWNNLKRIWSTNKRQIQAQPAITCSKLTIKTPKRRHVNNRDTRTRCWICSKLTIKIPEQRHWRRVLVL